MSAFSAVMAMVNWHIGTALYTFPTIYREFGVLSATTALVMCAVMTVAVYALLDRASVGCRLTHFVDVTNTRLGQHAGRLLTALVVVNAIGVFCSYFRVVSTCVADEGPLGTVFILGLLIVAAACACSEKIEEILFANEIANSAVVVLLVGILWLRVSTAVIDSSAASSGSSLQASRSVATLFDVCVFAFSSAEVYMTLEARHRRPAVTIQSVVISLVLYSIIGAAGSAIVGTSDDDILGSFRGKGWLGWIVVGTNLMSLILSLPAFIVTARTYFERSTGLNETRKWFSAAFCVVALFVHFLSPSVLQIITVVAAFTDVAFMLLFPALLLLKSNNPPLHLQVVSVTFLLLGLLLMFRTGVELMG